MLAKIAEAIKENLDLEGTYFEKCEIAGAGFMNFTLSGGYYRDIIGDVLKKGNGYGHSDKFSGKKALVEFVSANPT